MHDGWEDQNIKFDPGPGFQFLNLLLNAKGGFDMKKRITFNRQRANQNMSVVFMIAIVLLLHTPLVLAQVADANLQNFQRFVNGSVLIKEAVVYRKYSKTDGTLLNEEWWRFGYQGDTWYAQLLKPDKQDPSKFIPSESNTSVCGATYTQLWTVGDKDFHIADKATARGSVPDKYGDYYRNLMFSALSLGLPRQLDVLSIRESPIKWDGLQFTATVATKVDSRGNAFKTGSAKGKLSLGSNGLPASMKYSQDGDFKGASVTYEYKPETTGIPVIFVKKYGDKVMRYEFVSLTMGTNDQLEKDGYIPGMFANSKMERNYTFWTNDLSYSLIGNNFKPAFMMQPKRDTKHDRIAIISLLALAGVGGLTLWYRRSYKKTN